MYQSLEIRWFFKEEIPLKITNWFHSKSNRAYIEFSEPRTDTYLIFPESVACGVKSREGNFEIKTWTKNIGEYKSMAMQHWEKWSFGGIGTGNFVDAALNDGNKWQDVEKSRKLLFYEKDRPIKEVDQPVYDGRLICQFELSKILLNNNHWWSINLEATGSGNLQEFLLDSATILLDDCPNNLSAKNNMSYPSWLKLNS